MSKKKQKSFIANALIWYRKLQPVLCPAFDGELVYFNRSGFNHLIRRGKRPRLFEDQFRRIKMLYMAPEIILNAQSTNNYRCENMRLENTRSTVYFWSIISRVNDKDVHIVIRQIGNNPKHFFSIF